MSSSCPLFVQVKQTMPGLGAIALHRWPSSSSAPNASFSFLHKMHQFWWFSSLAGLGWLVRRQDFSVGCCTRSVGLVFTSSLGTLVRADAPSHREIGTGIPRGIKTSCNNTRGGIFKHPPPQLPLVTSPLPVF